MARVLLVVNMQEDYIGESRNKTMFYYDSKMLIQNVNNKISSYEPENVIYIKSIKKNNFFNRTFAKYCIEGTRGSELADGLKIVSDHIYTKTKGNAFIKNIALYEYLEKNQTDTVEVVGLDGGMCVIQTAQGAAEIGYKAEICKSCVGTVFRTRAEVMEKTSATSGIKYI